jgi:hypothetical protein
MPFDNPFEGPFGDVRILMDARSRIADADRWLQRGFRHGDRHCLVATLSLACKSRNFDRPNETERRLTKLLAKQLPHSYWVRMIFITSRQRLILFNDLRCTQHEDVLALFDRTIEHLACRVPLCTVL